MSYQLVWNWYSKESVQKALLEVAANREVVSVFKDGSFGKRPDILQYQQDILQSIAEGTISFHGSLEKWSQPMKLDVGMNRPDLDSLRIGWDVLIDPDVPDFEIGKIVTQQIVEAFKDHGVKNYSIKYTGGKGFHIGISFGSLPEKINFQSTNLLYPELLHKIIHYIKWYIRDGLKDELLTLDTPLNLAQRIGKNINEIASEDGIEPFKIVSMDVFSSRHLFRLPYSLHESSLLVSLPLNPKQISKFEKEYAKPEKVKVEERFLLPTESHDAEALIVETLDWAEKYSVEIKEELPKLRKIEKVSYIAEDYFPPCVKEHILKGLSDGKKRSTFILINFLKNMGWSGEQIEKRLEEWNEKNYPSLRTNFLRTQLRWHFRQDRNLLPPNCDNEAFYKSMGVCHPDAICKNEAGEITIKNPVNYPFRKLKRTPKLETKRK
jgi:hypothetical protein